MVKACVIAVDSKFVTLDPGYKYTQNFFKRELAGVPIYAEDGELPKLAHALILILRRDELPGSFSLIMALTYHVDAASSSLRLHLMLQLLPADRRLTARDWYAGTRLGIPEEYAVGDILHVKVDALETPFGDMQLSLGGKVRHERSPNANERCAASAHPMLCVGHDQPGTFGWHSESAHHQTCTHVFVPQTTMHKAPAGDTDTACLTKGMVRRNSHVTKHSEHSARS